LNPEGILGPIYGYQWRNFNANYNCISGKKVVAETHRDSSSDDDHTDRDIFREHVQYKGVDQLQDIIDQLTNPATRNSRRLILSAWNPVQLSQMALPPCHIMCQFFVQDGDKLSCAMFQRSADVCLGVPFNISSYCFLTHLIAHHCGLVAHEFVYFIGNAHIYNDHVEGIQQQLERAPFEFPTLTFAQKRAKVEDYLPEDFVVHNYQSHAPISLAMVV